MLLSVFSAGVEAGGGASTAAAFAFFFLDFDSPPLVTGFCVAMAAMVDDCMRNIERVI